MKRILQLLLLCAGLHTHAQGSIRYEAPDSAFVLNATRYSATVDFHFQLGFPNEVDALVVERMRNNNSTWASCRYVAPDSIQRATGTITFTDLYPNYPDQNCIYRVQILGHEVARTYPPIILLQYKQ